MKRCPECRRDYFDDSLLYCLDDGTALLEGPATDDQRTAVLPDLDVNTLLLQNTAPEHSIAVLPFVNMSSDSENDFFCDGLAEEILNALTKIESLKVAARTSAFSFKGTNTKVSEIGHALGVRNILEGASERAVIKFESPSSLQMRLTVITSGRSGTTGR